MAQKEWIKRTEAMNITETFAILCSLLMAIDTTDLQLTTNPPDCIRVEVELLKSRKA